MAGWLECGICGGKEIWRSVTVGFGCSVMGFGVLFSNMRELVLALYWCSNGSPVPSALSSKLPAQDLASSPCSPPALASAGSLPVSILCLSPLCFPQISSSPRSQALPPPLSPALPAGH